MVTRALVTLSIARPGQSPVRVPELVSGAVVYAAEAVGAASALSGGVAVATAVPGLVGWSLSAEARAPAGSPARAALLAANRAGERLEVMCTLGDGILYAGSGYVTRLGRSGAASAAASTRVELTGDGALSACRYVEEAHFAESGGQGETITEYDLAPLRGLVTLSYEMFNIPDGAQIIHGGVVVADTGGLVSGQGTLAWEYDGRAPHRISVRIYAPQSGTAWNYTLRVPGGNPIPSNLPCHG